MTQVSESEDEEAELRFQANDRGVLDGRLAYQSYDVAHPFVARSVGGHNKREFENLRTTRRVYVE